MGIEPSQVLTSPLGWPLYSKGHTDTGTYRYCDSEGKQCEVIGKWIQLENSFWNDSSANKIKRKTNLTRTEMLTFSKCLVDKGNSKFHFFLYLFLILGNFPHNLIPSYYSFSVVCP